jgi:mannose-1-phosphate guanylyltransferase
MLNGDVLTDFDLSAQISQHERTGARATLALVAVEDPSAYGLVRCGPDHAVEEFIEKPEPGTADTNLVNAGAYVLERDVLGEMAPAGTNISIERDVFPKLIGRGLYGHATTGYWLDIGTPQRYLQATFDILAGTVHTELGAQLAEASSILIADGSSVDGSVVAPALVGAGCEIARDATVGELAVLGPRVRIAERAVVERSVVLEGSSVGTGSIVRGAIVGPNVRIEDGCQIDGDAVLGDGAVVGSGNVLEPGARIFPGVVLPEAIRS